MKNKVCCALCDAPANMYCESDRASLCWRCDNKVHGANFLVAKHTRSVLCHLCQATTPWSASGPVLPPSMSLCLTCVSTSRSNPTTQLVDDQTVQSRMHNEHDHDHDHDHDYDESSSNEDGDGEYEDEEDNENQVVPLTSSGTPQRSGMETTSSSSSEAEEEDDNSDILTTLPPSLKRTREVAFLQSSPI